MKRNDKSSNLLSEIDNMIENGEDGITQYGFMILVLKVLRELLKNKRV